MAIELPWASLPDVPGANVYRNPPAGAIVVPAVVYRPDEPWIEKRETMRTWLENYVAVCIVALSAVSAVEQLYGLVLAIKNGIDADRDSAWEWKGAGAIVRTEQAGLEYLACAVRLSFSATY